MKTEKILEYLKELQANNLREWYHSNKKQFQEANQEFENIIQALILEIGKTDSSILHNTPKELTFKIVRDTRYSNDKSPYNPAFRAHISSKGKLPIPVGYFIMIKPNNQSFLGGGLFADIFNNATSMIRDYIIESGNEWEKIITSPVFTKHFSIKGERLKNVPKGYDTNHPQADYIKHKSWYLEFPLSDDQVCNNSFISFASEIFIAMQPFNTFLNRALDKFEMPKRP